MKTKKTHKPQDVRLLDLCTRFSFEVGRSEPRPALTWTKPHQGEREKARRRRQMARDGGAG